MHILLRYLYLFNTKSMILTYLPKYLSCLLLFLLLILISDTLVPKLNGILYRIPHVLFSLFPCFILYITFLFLSAFGRQDFSSPTTGRDIQVIFFHKLIISQRNKESNVKTCPLFLYRQLKNTLKLRPIYHKIDTTIKGHIFCVGS